MSKYTAAHLIQVPSLDRSNRAFEGILSSQIIIRGTSNSSSDEHSGCTVEIRRSHLSGIGPEAPEECEEGVKDTTSVDEHTPFPETPARLEEEFWVVDTAAENAADGDGVQSQPISSRDFRLKARFYVTAFSLPLLNHPIMPLIRTPLAERNGNGDRGPELSELREAVLLECIMGA
jgi:hypothetical protein